MSCTENVFIGETVISFDTLVNDIFLFHTNERELFHLKLCAYFMTTICLHEEQKKL